MAAGKDNLKVRDAGAWKPTTPSIRDGGVWKEANSVWVKDAGVWKESYRKSDPVTIQRYATDSKSYRPSGWRSGSDIYQGSWSAGDHIGVMGFNAEVIQADLAIRPHVVSCSLRMTRKSNHGYNSAPDWIIWQVDTQYVNWQSPYEVITNLGQPTFWAIGEYGPTTDVFDHEETIDIPIPSRFITGARTSIGIAVSNLLPLVDPGGNDPSYKIFYGFDAVNVAYRPLLTYTIDYS